jgi:hypothetical protein
MSDPVDHTGLAASAPLVLRLYPSPTIPWSRTTIYDDDGESLGYLGREFATTPVTMTSSEATCDVDIGAAAGRYRGQTARRTIRAELVLPPGKTVTRVTLGGTTVSRVGREGIDRGKRGWALDGGVVYVQIPGAAIRSSHAIRVTY